MGLADCDYLAASSAIDRLDENPFSARKNLSSAGYFLAGLPFRFGWQEDQIASSMVSDDKTADYFNSFS